MIVMAAAILAVAGCASSTQLTSGQAYLDDYPAAAAAEDDSVGGKTFVATSDVDADVRAIAAVEPDLRFPARIGLARIQGAALTAAPPEELAAWATLAERLGPEVGEFVPVSPLIAEMVDPPSRNRYNRVSSSEVVGHIRRGAARQHLDYVLVYEVTTGWSEGANALSLADATVLGLFIVPSRNVEVEAAANALLIDVRNGYPYGTATAFAERGRAARAVYSGGAREGLTTAASLDAVTNLTGEVETMVGDLRAELARQALAAR
jgi:hypothetical protein